MTDAELKLSNILGSSWLNKIGEFMVSEEMKLVAKGVNARRKAFGVTVFPDRASVFKAFRLTAFEDVKVVFVGKSPSGITDVDDGLAFSSQDIFTATKENDAIKDAIETKIYNGLKLIFEKDLTRYANQGVFLLNQTLTCEKDKPTAHEKLGWYKLTKTSYSLLAEDSVPRVFILSGDNQEFDEGIDYHKNHLVIKCSDILDEGFIEEDVFNKANEFLKKARFSEINW